jgi:hypothetical protein
MVTFAAPFSDTNIIYGWGGLPQPAGCGFFVRPAWALAKG